jgi:prephenate dehydrogenase
MLSMARKVFSENPHLYYEIQALNPHNAACHQALSKSLQEIISSISEGNERRFVEVMTQAQKYLGEEAQEQNS